MTGTLTTENQAAQTADTAQSGKEPELAQSKPKPKRASKPRKPRKSDVSFAEMSLEDLTTTYNEMCLTGDDLGLACHPVESFKDAEVGAAACEQLHANIQSARDRKTQSEESDMRKNKAKTSGSRRAQKRTTGKRAARSTARPRAKFDEGAKIHWLIKENPCREGTGKHERVERIRKHSGKTVGTFIEHGGRQGSLAFSVRQRWIRVA